MERFLKKRLGVIILIVIALVFPISLSNQARLNTRIIVTGLAIDKNGENYEITAQIVKTTPGTETPGTSATVNFISDTDETMVGALSKLTYKAGKVAAFSHTNFVILGKDILEDNINEVLDYFLRNQTIKSSALLLFANDKASDEIKKTKDVELSTGIGLQKVFLFKENEGDGEMTTILNFLNDSKSFSQTATASILKLMNNEESLKKEDQEKGSDSNISSGDSSNNSSSESSSSKEESSSSGDLNSSSSSGSSESGGEGDKYQYFEALSPIVCCKNGKYVGKLETKDEITGYMIVKNKSKSEDISLKNINADRLKNAKIGINVDHKHSTKKIRYENNIACLDIVIYIDNSEIEHIENEKYISELSKKEYEEIKIEIEKDTCQKVAKCFEKSKSIGADIFRAYDLAIKYHYDKTKSLYDSVESFLENLKLNVQVEIIRLDY